MVETSEAEHMEPKIEALLNTVENYITALNQHDLDYAGTFLAANVVMNFVGTDYELNKAQILSSLGWDMGTKARFSYTVAETVAEAVVVDLTETNNFLELLSVPPLQARMEFQFNNENLIRSVSYEASGGSVKDPGAVARALEPVIKWASQNDADILAEVYDGEHIQYSRQSAEGWVKLLSSWRESQAT